eukprot:2976316-Amphidinium_carterae.1
MQRSELKRRPDESKVALLTRDRAPNPLMRFLTRSLLAQIYRLQLRTNPNVMRTATHQLLLFQMLMTMMGRILLVLERFFLAPALARVLGEGQHSTRPLESLPSHDAGSSVTKGDLMEMHCMLLGSFSQLGSNAGSTELQLTLVQEKLSTAQHSACRPDVPLRVHPPGVVQPMLGKLAVDVARSTSPCARQHVDAPPVPQLGDGASIFTAQRGRSPPRVSSMAKLGRAGPLASTTFSPQRRYFCAVQDCSHCQCSTVPATL